VPEGVENAIELNGHGRIERATLFAGAERVGYRKKTHTGLYVKDHLGSTKMVLALHEAALANALMVSFDETDAYGLTLRHESDTESQDEGHWFTGQEREDELGLYYYGARWYMPEIGRFLQVDPAREFVNPYSYVGNHPISFVDEDGEMAGVVAVAAASASIASGFGQLMREFGSGFFGSWMPKGPKWVDGIELSVDEQLALSQNLTSLDYIKKSRMRIKHRPPTDSMEVIVVVVDGHGNEIERYNEGLRRGVDTALAVLFGRLPLRGYPAGSWILPRSGGGALIGGRWYTEHALERMAPKTLQVMAELEKRALLRAQKAGVRPGTAEFKAWWKSMGPNPRGIPTSIVEAEIRNPGSTSVRVIMNSRGHVVTVMHR